MGLRTLVAFAVTAVIIAKVSGSVPEDGNSVAELGRTMNEKFLQLFQRLDRLEAKVDRMAGNKDGSNGKSGSGRAVELNQGGTELPRGVTVEPYHGSNETQTEENLNEVQRLKNILSSLVTVPACQRNAAHLPQPVVVATVNASQNLSCETKGEPLAVCLWGRSLEGTRDVIVIDRQVVENDGRTAGERMNYAGDSGDFDAGKCTVNINSVTEKDAGLWSCNLVTRNSTVFSGAVHLALASDDGTPRIGTKRTGVKCEDSHTDFLMILKQVFEEGQHCAPCPDCDITAKGKLAEAEAKLQRKEKNYKDLIAAFATPSSRIRRARLQLQTVFALVNTSATLSCGSSDVKEWSLCTWEKKMHGNTKLVVIDQEVAQNGGQTLADGISYVDSRQNNTGTCEITVQYLTPQHFGQWSCTLLSRNGSISKAELLIQNALKRSIYFATSYQGVSAFSLETNQVMKTVSSGESLYGITFDSIANKLYWSSDNLKIYRANMDGSSVETVLSTSTYGYIYGLAFDWIGGNIYVVTSNGYILACGAGTSRAFNCYTVLHRESDARGISLNPTEGIMYWTRLYAGSIHKAGMDGSSPVTLVSGLGYPVGVTIDFASRRLYWTEYNSNKIQSSNLDGRDVRLVVQLPSDPYPWGIAVLNNRIYWGNRGNNKLQSCNMNGQDVQTLYTENDDIHHITIVPAPDQPSSRKNDCEGRNCSKLCVLSPSSYRCLT